MIKQNSKRTNTALVTPASNTKRCCIKPVEPNKVRLAYSRPQTPNVITRTETTRIYEPKNTNQLRQNPSTPLIKRLKCQHSTTEKKNFAGLSLWERIKLGGGCFDRPIPKNLCEDFNHVGNISVCLSPKQSSVQFYSPRTTKASDECTEEGYELSDSE